MSENIIEEVVNERIGRMREVAVQGLWSDRHYRPIPRTQVDVDAYWKAFCEAKIFPLIDAWEEEVRRLLADDIRRVNISDAWHELEDVVSLDALDYTIRLLQSVRKNAELDAALAEDEDDYEDDDEY